MTQPRKIQIGGPFVFRHMADRFRDEQKRKVYDGRRVEVEPAASATGAARFIVVVYEESTSVR